MVLSHSRDLFANALSESLSKSQALLNSEQFKVNNGTIHQWFEFQVAQTPDVVAAVFEDKQLTYRELNQRANQLAHYLKTLGVGPEVLVGICAQHSLEMVVGSLGILKAGGAYVPMDPSYPKERLLFMLEDTQMPVLLTQQGLLNFLPEHHAQVVNLDTDWEVIARESSENPKSNVTSDNLAYVIYTSGSTGKPKGVMVVHQGVNRLVLDTNYINIGPKDVVAQCSNFSFDAATFEIWGALLNGAKLIAVTRDVAISPKALAAFLREQGISMLFLTTALFNQMAREVPKAFSSVQHVLFGGEAVDLRSVKEVLKHSAPRRLLHVYGPTENTTFSTWYWVQNLPDEAKTIPIGQAIANTQFYVLDEKLQPVKAGVPGELYLGGAGLARGYLNRPELTEERFIPNPFCTELGDRLYKTGDLVRTLPDGNIEFIGRIDQQVKIRGFRIELGEIETVLWNHPAVQDAVVIAREDVPGDKRLVAYVVPSSATFSLFELRCCLKQKLPEYMVPSGFVKLEALPLTPNGKVDRRALPACNCFRPELAVDFIAPRTATEEKIAELWTRILRIERVGVEDNFLDLGGNSLLAAELIMRLQEIFEIELPVRLLFESPTVAGLAQKIEHSRLDAAPFTSTKVDLKAEAVLDAEIYPKGKTTLRVSEPHQIFLTGATGFLGAFLLRELLNQTPANIHCLVRSPNVTTGLENIQKTLKKYGIWDPSFISRIIPVPGDLTQPLLGLSIEQFANLAAQIDVIYHSGAQVNYIHPYSFLKAANVLGTQEVLRLACQKQLKPVHYISTIAVFGPIGYFTGCPELKEEDDLDKSEEYLHQDIGYSQSKWVGEKLVEIAKSRGVPVCIFRPGFVMGDSQTGINNTNDFVSRMIKGCIQLGCYPELVAQSKQFVTVDYASRAIVHVSRQQESVNKAFNLVPRTCDNLQLVDFFEAIRACGYPLKKLPYSAWKEEFIKQTKHSQDNALFPFWSMLTEKVHQSLTAWELYERMPDYSSQNTLAALAGTDITCPPMDAKLLDTYFSHFIRSGFLETAALT